MRMICDARHHSKSRWLRSCWDRTRPVLWPLWRAESVQRSIDVDLLHRYSGALRIACGTIAAWTGRTVELMACQRRAVDLSRRGGRPHVGGLGAVKPICGYGFGMHVACRFVHRCVSLKARGANAEWPVCVERTVCQALTLFEVSAHALRPPCMRFVPLLEADYACNARGLCRVPGVNVSHVFLPCAGQNSTSLSS